jgi:hypothetical protein
MTVMRRWNKCCVGTFMLRSQSGQRRPANSIDEQDHSPVSETPMIPPWSDWKRYPHPGRNDNIEAPISPGIYEIRYAEDGALFGFEAVDNLAVALARLQVEPKGFGSWFGRRGAPLPELEYRVCATATRAHARTAAERMVHLRGTWISGAA